MFAHPRPKKPLLTPSSKKRKLHSATEEISFSFDARADYLTGFHKRKVQRAKHAQEEALKRAKAERIEQRKQLREERRREIETHVEAVTTLSRNVEHYGTEAGDTSDEEWNGIVDNKSSEIMDIEQDYVDDDRHITVTVEEVDVSRHGLHKKTTGDDHDNNTGDQHNRDLAHDSVAAKKPWPKKKRKMKFRYESKAERKFTSVKQRSGNRIKADARKAK